MCGLLLLQDRAGKLANGAIANLVDEVGGAVTHVEGLPMNVSVDMSISFLSTARVDVSLASFICAFCFNLRLCIVFEIGHAYKSEIGRKGLKLTIDVYLSNLAYYPDTSLIFAHCMRWKFGSDNCCGSNYAFVHLFYEVHSWYASFYRNRDARVCELLHYH